MPVQAGSISYEVQHRDQHHAGAKAKDGALAGSAFGPELFQRVHQEPAAVTRAVPSASKRIVSPCCTAAERIVF